VEKTLPRVLAGKVPMTRNPVSAVCDCGRPGFRVLSKRWICERCWKIIRSWEELLAACGEIAEGKHPFKTVILGTVDNAYRMCSDYICAKFKIEHESDLGYGKGWALINNEFHRVLTKLAFLPYGLFLVSHSQEKEIETRTGKYIRIIPTLPDKARKIVLGMVDLILFCDLEVTSDESGKPVYRRVMRTKPSPHYEAGDRTGRLPDTIDLNFQAFIKPPQGNP